MKIDGKRALVLGGTSGIGLAVVQMLTDKGATVIGFGRSEANIERAQSAVSAATFRSLDVLDRQAMAQVFAELAPFDILVNAATGGERATGPFMQMDLDGFSGSFAKLWGYVNSVRLAGQHLSDNGCITLVSGSPARKCQPGMSAISTVGNAVEGFTRAIAPEIAPKRINVVSPGLIDTPMFPGEGDSRQQFFAKATGNNPIKRAGTPEEVAAGILFAIENDFVTGSTIDVDGGAILP
jgi:NAD(P)-dependent dehydrogenase (short-subunit alcohol dehydrogenase family)